ncbi:IS4 family transposase [Aporhodopirellula aestuarii]|uniref:IS4 family transposase n=1 Tax=Aporhodopirellula aestuarii TaxID=2950107 RepID=A0ABT0UE39_9BACT|nr:IS4 family transposase [Aporhodopirellula aestuarii]MCM2375168.1 IS4 family transposase [Aporhodopirellula aestuarii]
MEPRLQRRYLQLVQEHMKSANRNAAGPSLLPGENQAFSATQATWRFLSNPNVSLLDLIEPLREVGRQAASQSESAYMLLAHDWCKIDYKSHTAKKDLRQITHEHDIGYEMSTSLLIDGASGDSIAPMQMHLKTGDAVHSTSLNPPAIDVHRLDELPPTMAQSQQWGLDRKLVHVIDREADSLGRMRQWDELGHLFLVRCDDRRVKWNGQSVLLSEIADHFDREILFEPCGEALYHGKRVTQEVAETEVVLHRQHSEVVDGKKCLKSGKPLSVRLVVTRLLDEDDYVLAQWTLLCNVRDASINSYQVALWYYWRWLIETYFKLLKSHGQELEQWQQQGGGAIARRILVASMACVAVVGLQNDQSEEAKKTKKILIRLSGRQMKYGVESTPPALLAGYMILLSMTDLLESPDIDIGQLKQIAANALPFRLV